MYQQGAEIIFAAMTKSIEASCTFLVPPHVLYSAFLDSRDLSRMVLAPASISPVIGGEFTMFNGGVQGSISELEPDTKIVEKWRFSQWDEGVFSTLELSFTACGSGKCKLVVKQTGIPHTDKHGNGEQDQLVLRGWTDKFFIGLEKVLGFGVDRD